MRKLALAATLLLAGCVGAVNDYARTAQTFGEEASDNTITNWMLANDAEARALAAGYCGLMRSGAVQRRYRDMVDLNLRQQVCDMEAKLGFVGP